MLQKRNVQGVGLIVPDCVSVPSREGREKVPTAEFNSVSWVEKKWKKVMHQKRTREGLATAKSSSAPSSDICPQYSSSSDKVVNRGVHEQK